jgi:hypothetical protein
MKSKLRGTKRVRFNAVLDHLDDQRIRRQAKVRNLSLADALRLGIDMLEEDYNRKRAVIIAATENHENGDGV